MRRFAILSLAVTALLTTAAAASGKTIYVDTDANGSGTGTNWANAYPYLQDALADANTSAKPVEIRVAQGTYKPDEGAGVTDGDRTATFRLMNGVTLKGDYAGDGEPDPNARDIDSYETILSGDLDGNDIPVATSGLLTEPTRAENSYHVVTGSGADANAVLDGFTITAGNANSTVSPNKNGAGIKNGSPTLLNCTFSAHSGNSSGGAMSTWEDVGPVITNCIFSGNFSGRNGGGIYGKDMTLTNCTFTENSAGIGGGMYVASSNATLTNCTFSNNSGNGLYLGVGDTAVLTNCTFSENSGSAGGGLYLSAGSSDNPELTDCVFIDNSAGGTWGDGGGMYLYGGGEPRLINCIFIGNSASNNGGGMFSLHFQGTDPKVTNCIFSGNTASGDGGAVCSTHDYTTFTNCTFSENSAAVDGGAYCIFNNGGTADFNNCIFWGNTANNEGPQIAMKTSSIVTVDYSDIEGGVLDIYKVAGATLNYDASNIDSDPLFVDADGADDAVGTEDDNLRLLAGSPCIDAGDNTAVPVDTADLDGDGNTAEPIPLDLNGFARFIDDLCTADTGNPGAPGPIVDMGAYEFLRSDIDSDGDVNFKDFSQFASYWQDVACGACGGADLTCDGDVNAYDLKELADNWLSNSN
ncbi:MAG: right-handed parallel beta-helix repeat-containing protein [Planctomycetota bacterium]|jgi:parallel beta-helix repeat protein/predicted outer membrane repeat protein